MPTFVDKVTSKNSWGTPANSLSFDLGTSYPAGTFFLLWVASWDAGAGIDLTSVAGWNTVQILTEGAGQAGTLMYRFAEANEPAIQSISGSNPADFQDVLGGTLMVFSGVNNTNPIHTYLMEGGNGADISPTGIPNEGSYPLPEITTVIDGCTIVTGTCHKNPNQDKINIGVIPSGYLYVDSIKDVTAPNAPWADTIIFRSDGDRSAGTYSGSVTIEDTDLDASGEFPEWVTFTVALAGITPTYQPPLSWISNSEVRTLGFHAYQIFELLTGSGDPAAMPDYHLDITGSTGSGPFYNITLAYDAATLNGLNNIQIGDKLIIGDDIDNATGGAKQWYRYDITAISSKSASSASITVKYISDTASGGDISPDDLHYEYGAYSASLDLNIIAREIQSAAFFLG